MTYGRPVVLHWPVHDPFITAAVPRTIRLAHAGSLLDCRNPWGISPVFQFGQESDANTIAE
jgi:hypothetical protein